MMMIREGKNYPLSNKPLFSFLEKLLFSYIYDNNYYLRNYILGLHELYVLIFFCQNFCKNRSTLEKRQMTKRQNKCRMGHSRYKSIYYRPFRKNLNHTPFRNVTITTRMCKASNQFHTFFLSDFHPRISCACVTLLSFNNFNYLEPKRIS